MKNDRRWKDGFRPRLCFLGWYLVFFLFVFSVAGVGLVGSLLVFVSLLVGSGLGFVWITLFLGKGLPALS